MSEVHIFELNDDCMRSVIQYLSVEDKFNLYHVCTFFRQLLTECSGKCQKMICNAYEKSHRQKLLLGSHNVKELSIALNNTSYYWPLLAMPEMLCKIIEGMTQLEHLSLSIDANLARWQPVVLALRNLPKFKSLSISGPSQQFQNCNRPFEVLPNYFLKNLSHLRHLEELSLTAQVYVHDLVEYCKSNDKLRALRLHGGCEGNISAIATHCPNLEEVKFRMEKETDYEPVTKLPKLKKLIIEGNVWYPMAIFFKTFSSESLEQLQLIDVQHIHLDFEATQQIVRMKALKSLSCYFREARSMELLSQLKELEEIFIVRSNFVGFPAAFLKILTSCTKLDCFCIGDAFELTRDLIFQVAELLESIRNPIAQEPLKLELGVFTKLSPRDARLIDTAYLRLGTNPYSTVK
ncbi:uncharacterized protein LOC115632144 [Scaptodrosophila lebanonensis]|uniref:Uncharacterized protein LOC115632144 n=1 Tax=Drosophila lebanonensis TaxID=7225 RepID=A0A6J2UD22_DROLE|nr:uncharacterized protein LOC115632144 [Scaptodrosophila lebanonensis]